MAIRYMYMEIKKININQTWSVANKSVSTKHASSDSKAIRSDNSTDVYIPKSIQSSVNYRPMTWDEYIWQEEIKNILSSAIFSAKKSWHTLGHILVSWPSWYGKTTLAQIIAKELSVNIKIITAYAINKPSEIISILNSLSEGDVLFIDEIHRLLPKIEEVLYTAMEDRSIDMVMPEWWSVRIPLSKFTLIWATTMMEKLSTPFKNRFVYKFHLAEYNSAEKSQIIARYLNHYNINFDDKLLNDIHERFESVPREIHNMCIKIRDYTSSHTSSQELKLDIYIRNDFVAWIGVDSDGLGAMHHRYLEILKTYDKPVWVKTIAMKLGINPQSVEDDIEPILVKLGKIDRTHRGRIYIY